MCRCGALIPQSIKTCEKCKETGESRHAVYNRTRRDKRAAEFYISKEWRAMRQVIMSVYDYIDVYALYETGNLIAVKESDPVHHIIELEENWTQRLNPLNLIPLSSGTHNTVTALYKRDRRTMKETQERIRQAIEYHFKEEGGIRKVLERQNLVAPPLNLGENSPREFR